MIVVLLQEATTVGVQEVAQGPSATDWITAGATIVVAIYAIVTAHANRRMVREAQESREAQERPYVVVDLDYVTRDPYVDVVVRNDGRRSARNIEFSFSAPLVNYDDVEVSSQLGYFREGLQVLAPGGTVPNTLGNRQHVISKFREHVISKFREQGVDDVGITVTVTYESLDGKRYEDEWTLNPVRFAERRQVQTTNHLEEISSQLGNLSTHLDKLVYIQTLETRRPWWRRVLNLQAYDPNKP